jgi:hypothetical protein
MTSRRVLTSKRGALTVATVRLRRQIALAALCDGLIFGVLGTFVLTQHVAWVALHSTVVGAAASLAVATLLGLVYSSGRFYTETFVLNDGEQLWPLSEDLIDVVHRGERCSGVLLFGEDRLDFACTRSGSRRPSATIVLLAPFYVLFAANWAARHPEFSEEPTGDVPLVEVTPHPLSATWMKSQVHALVDGLNGVYLATEGGKVSVVFKERDTRVRLIAWCRARNIAVKGFSESAAEIT